MSGCPAYLILQRKPREALDTLLHCIKTPEHEGKHRTLWPADIGGGVGWTDGMTGTVIVVPRRPQQEEA